MQTPLRTLWGALVGDAAGATLEFYSGGITEAVAVRALALPGGGALGVGPGQITDDGELSLALWSVLRNKHPQDGFPLEEVARAYVAWYASFPFDIGYTCSNAFEHLQEWTTEGGNLDTTLQTISSLLSGSQANGALMRATPLAAWYASHPAGSSEETAQRAAQSAILDALLSHPSRVTQDANAVYVYALTLLLLGVSPSATASRVDSYASTLCDTVRQWVNESKGEWSTLPNTEVNIGHARHALTMALWFLRHSEVEVEEALLHTLMKGGDTDTNAAIVGGLVACYHPVPFSLLQGVHDFDGTQQKRKRPAAYGVRWNLNLPATDT